MWTEIEQLRRATVRELRVKYLELFGQESRSNHKQFLFRCPKCQGKLFCENCKEYPLHRRYAGEAIREIVEAVQPTNAEEVFKTLQLIRHTLMHGGRISSIQSQLPCSEQEAVNKLAFVTWQAIARMFSNPDPREEEPLNFGYCDNLVRRTLTFGAHIKTTLVGGDPNNPRLADFPHVQIDAVPEPWPSPQPESPRD